MPERIVTRRGMVGDVAAARALFDVTLPLHFPSSFYADVSAALEPGVASPQFLVSVAELDGELVGAAVLAVFNHADALRAGHLPCALVVDTSDPALRAACVLLLAVAPASRRHGVGTRLLEHGVAAAGADPRVRVVFLHALARDARACGFYAAARFTRIGTLPAHFRLALDDTPDAALLAAPLAADVELARYEPAPGGDPPDLTAAPKLLREEPFPPLWLQRLANPYVAPFVVFALLFAVSQLGVVVTLTLRAWSDARGGEGGRGDPLSALDL